MVGSERFNLAMQLGGLESTDGDWAIISSQPTVEEGVALLSRISGAAGWGTWEIVRLDRAHEQLVLRARNSLRAWTRWIRPRPPISCAS